MDVPNLIVELVGRAVGGNIAGAALKKKSVGLIANSLSGIVGGGIGGTILQARSPRHGHVNFDG
jgi:uncharacterized membrane protein YeaQ/YmgE (transglycosylase-associated protein family)